jgi:hypothetical protein
MALIVWVILRHYIEIIGELNVLNFRMKLDEPSYYGAKRVLCIRNAETGIV